MATLEEVAMVKGRKSRDRRWTPDEARAILEEVERRGISVKRFARERGLGEERLYRWKRRLARRPSRAAVRPVFTEVTVGPSAPGATIEIELPGGIGVRVGGASRLEDAVALLTRLR
jgi:transposase-like protein